MKDHAEEKGKSISNSSQNTLNLDFLARLKKLLFNNSLSQLSIILHLEKSI